MLLEGIIKHLPRKNFHVTVCPIDAPGRRLSPALINAADEVVRLQMKLRIGTEIVGDLRWGHGTFAVQIDVGQPRILFLL